MPGEPYDVSDKLVDRVLSLLTATVAAILTTMLITALMQLIEADSATEAALEDAAQKMVAEELRNAAGCLNTLCWLLLPPTLLLAAVLLAPTLLAAALLAVTASYIAASCSAGCCFLHC